MKELVKFIFKKTEKEIENLRVHSSGMDDEVGLQISERMKEYVDDLIDVVSAYQGLQAAKQDLTKSRQNSPASVGGGMNDALTNHPQRG